MAKRQAGRRGADKQRTSIESAMCFSLRVEALAMPATGPGSPILFRAIRPTARTFVRHDGRI